MTRTKYILPDSRPIIAITPGDEDPPRNLTLELSPNDALWSGGQQLPGTQQRVVLAKRAEGL